MLLPGEIASGVDGQRCVKDLIREGVQQTFRPAGRLVAMDGVIQRQAFPKLGAGDGCAGLHVPLVVLDIGRRQQMAVHVDGRWLPRSLCNALCFHDRTACAAAVGSRCRSATVWPLALYRTIIR